MIRTALLSVPQMDNAALDTVRGALARRALRCDSGRAGCGLTAHMDCRKVAHLVRRNGDNFVLTVGGTLPAPVPAATEIVPEATLDVLDRLTPALPEAMRAEAQMLSALALLDSGVAGIRSRTLIINLPAGAAAVFRSDAIVDIIPAYIAHLQGDIRTRALMTLLLTWKPLIPTLPALLMMPSCRGTPKRSTLPSLPRSCAATRDNSGT